MGKVARRTSGQVEKYEPAQGLKNIAIAKVAEEQFASAKDAARLREALRAKREEMLRFVLWWDEQEKHPGRRPSKNPLAVSDQQRLKAGSDGLPDRLTLHRWRTRLKDPRKFDQAQQRDEERCVQIAEFNRRQGTKGDTSENPEWYTPDEYLAAVRDVLGEIDLDPASSDKAQALVQATRYFTKKEDGLRQDWHGRVFLNPPYTHPDLPEFVGKMVAEVRAERVSAAIMLTHNYTDTQWFKLAGGACTAICFTEGRVKFLDVNGNEAAPTQGQAFFYYGQDRARFTMRFREIGLVWWPPYE